jgi:hypothetical protein
MMQFGTLEPDPGTSETKRPLRFKYLWTGGRESRVTLYNWEEDGAFVCGTQKGRAEVCRYLKVRIWDWYDESYAQLKFYSPRKGNSF